MNGTYLAIDTGASEASQEEKGGAVYLTDGASYTMSGGSISGKKVKYGGAVFIESGSTFTMNGGTLTGNTAKYGGAIYVSSGATCNINGGEITGNYAEYEPAIYVEEGGILNINNQQVVHDNTFQLWDITINYYVDGELNNTIERLVTDGTTFDRTEAPLDYNSCPGYYVDSGLYTPIEDGTDFLTYDKIDTATTGVVDLYTLTATPEKLSFTLTNGEYIAEAKDASIADEVVLPRHYGNVPVDIKAQSFKDCAEITKVFLHPHITEIYEGTFSGATSLEEVNIPYNVTTIGAGAFENCTALYMADYAGSIEDWFNVTLEDKASNPMYHGYSFRTKGSEVVGVTLDTSLTRLGYHLTGFKQLESLTLSNVEVIGDYALYNCLSLESISIPSSVVTIENNAFNGSGLKNIVVPSTVESIDEAAFANCVYLSKISLDENTTISTSALPTPSDTYLENADGNWYNLSTSQAYSPSEIPQNTTATYVARKGRITLAEASGSLIYPEIKEVEVLENTSGAALTVVSSNPTIATAEYDADRNLLVVCSNTTMGTATITITSEATSEYASGSTTYTVSVAYGTLTVTSSGYEGTYDGLSHSITVSCEEGGAISYSTTSGGTYSSVNPSYTDAGTYTVYYKVEKAGYVTVTGSEVVKINKAAGKVELSSTSGSLAYPATTTITVKTNLSGGTLSVSSSSSSIATASISGTTVTVASNTVAGNATITVTSAATTNYNEASATYAVTVTNGTLNVTASGYTGTYDGAAHSISVSCTEGGTITYSTSSTGTYSSTNPSYTTAGTYTVYYKVVKAGYTTVTGSKQVVINKAAGKVELSATSGTITYPGSASVTVKTNVSGGTLSVSTSSSSIATASISGTTVTITAGTTAGTATITVTSAETTNYNAASATYTATIKNGTLTVTASGYSGTYDGEAHSISVSCEEGGTITYSTSSSGTYSSTNPSYANAGTYTVYYKVVKAGYITATGNKQVVISKATGTISVLTSSISLTKDETVKTTASLVGDGTLSVISASESIATVSISSGVITITGVGGGTTTLTVSAADGTNYTYPTTQKITVTVKALVSIDITNAPNDTAYIHGEAFDSRGMEVVANYSDGTSKVLYDNHITSLIPAGYTILEYVQSTGEQWIDSGATIGAYTRVDSEIMFDSAFNWNMMYGAWGSVLSFNEECQRIMYCKWWLFSSRRGH